MPHLSPVADPPSHDLAQRVSLFLRAQTLAVGRPLDISATGGVVTIRGCVPSFYQRQLVLALARRVAGVLQVNDGLHVATPDDSPTARCSHAAVARSHESAFSSPIA
jgi:osmotically-inducible protein OsmY